jgi:hypothetical protein
MRAAWSGPSRVRGTDWNTGVEAPEAGIPAGARAPPDVEAVAAAERPGRLRGGRSDLPGASDTLRNTRRTNAARRGPSQRCSGNEKTHRYSRAVRAPVPGAARTPHLPPSTSDMSEPRLFTSESVSMGHPDKICDQISDAILDAMLAKDPHSRVAVRDDGPRDGSGRGRGRDDDRHLCRYPGCGPRNDRGDRVHDSRLHFANESCAVLVALNKQSQDIAQGVDLARAGRGRPGHDVRLRVPRDDDLMPLPIHSATAWSSATRRSAGRADHRRPAPGRKSQVTIEYENGHPWPSTRSSSRPAHPSWT